MRDEGVGQVVVVLFLVFLFFVFVEIVGEDLVVVFWIRFLVCLGDEDSTRRPASHAHVHASGLACTREEYSGLSTCTARTRAMRCHAHAPVDASFLSLHRQDLSGVNT